METPGSEMSSDSTDSSSTDSSSAEPSTAQNVPSIGEIQVSTNMNTTSVTDNNDSASDISMSAETEDEDGETLNIATIKVNPAMQVLEPLALTGPASDTSKKRKFPDSMDTPSSLAQNGISHKVRKRLKPDEALPTHWTQEGHLRQDKSLLPAEIWHHIFTFSPPRVLGLLLRVNKSFNAYLDPSSSGNPILPLSRSVAQILNPDAIWRASRRLFRPGMPSPLIGKSELDMWKLACSSSCQFCGKNRQPGPMFPLDQWHPGPGENGIVPIWSFGIRTCGLCLQEQTSKVGSASWISSLWTPLISC